MKTNIFGDLKDKIKKAKESTDEEYYDENEEYDDEYAQDEYDDVDPENSYASTYESDDDYDDFRYTPSSSSKSSASSRSSAASSRYSRYGDTNIYKMNNESAASGVKVSKVIYFNLEEAEDARDIADCMIKKDSVILADITRLSTEDAKKVLNFLDGVRYICKSSIEQISNIHLIVPESVELTGDFYGQMSQGTFLG
ncbi:MAG: cell division protein SepF [Acutalibacteraceae bacterium]